MRWCRRRHSPANDSPHSDRIDHSCDRPRFLPAELPMASMKEEAIKRPQREMGNNISTATQKRAGCAAQDDAIRHSERMELRQRQQSFVHSHGQGHPDVLHPRASNSMLQCEPTSDISSHAEVSRILRTKSARDVLGFAGDKKDRAGWRRAYLQKSLMVHPDKCKHRQAGEAFRRLNEAYKHFTEGTPWRFSHDGLQESSHEGDSAFHGNFAHGATFNRSWARRDHFSSPEHGSFHGSCSHSATFNESWAQRDNFSSPTGDAGCCADPFEFFSRTAKEAFQAGDISQENFSRMFGDLLGKPAVAGGALVGAALVGGVGSLLGGALGTVVGGIVSATDCSSCRCRNSPYGRCGACRAKMAGGTSGGASVGGTAGLLIGSALGAAVGGIAGAVAAEVASRKDADSAQATRPRCPDGCSFSRCQRESRSTYCTDCSQIRRPWDVIYKCSRCSSILCQTCHEEAMELAQLCAQQ